MSPAILFGKIPSHGDFVARGLAAPDRESLDRWLAAEVAIARTLLAERFEQAFDAAPPWRFAWREQAGAGEGWTAGAMAPSVDSVGRRFPILLGCRGVAATQAEGAAQRCEEAIYAAVAEGWDAGRLSAAAVTGTGPAVTAIADDCWWTAGGDGFGADRLRGRRPPNLMLHILSGGEVRA